jgi:N6-L-threonylcarbamoyladenine synthase
MIILGIESSCDDSCAAILDINTKTNQAKVLANIIISQTKSHAKYGGVVPELAARFHTENIIPAIVQALKKAKVTKDDIDYIAVTVKLGLITSLMAGAETAKALSYAWKKPIIGVNHLEGHIYANFISPKEPIKFPCIILTVSGGHTDLVLMKDHGKYKIIGDTKDDACGEAFDKGAVMLGMKYPGGPEIGKAAKAFAKTGQKCAISLPRPMLHSPNYDFSFSGLKTALLYQLQKDKNWKKRIPEYAFAYEDAIIDILTKKTIRAAKAYRAKSVILTGGVSANLELRRILGETVKTAFKNKVAFHIPDLGYTMDNAAMIAIAGYYQLRRKERHSWTEIKISTKIEL